MPVVVQGLGNVLLLLVSVGHIRANPVGLGRQGSCNSDLVCKGVMEVKSNYSGLRGVSFCTLISTGAHPRGG